MLAVNEEFNEENSIIESTTIKTIRNLKSRKSYTNVLSSRDDYPNSNDNTNIPPQTPTQNEEDSNYKTDETSARHKKATSMPNSVIKNPMRKATKLKIQKLRSDIQLPSEQNQQNEGNLDAYGSMTDNLNPIYYGENTITNQSGKNNSKQGNGMSSSLSKSYNRQSSLSNHVQEEIKVQKEYVTIDMEYAIQFVLTKSKALKDKIEGEGIMQAFINQHIVKNKFFQISYNSFLQNLINHKVLNPDFKNVSKKMFEKLEKFFFDRLQKCQDTVSIQQNYVKKSKSVYSAIEKRIQELKKDLADKNKIEL
ncbi:hypothetical protein TTHERM_00623010 (macronuclear) [Tetrahymena thermophila SB210]|uniref:Uncharacterized protein n=1 Tax=Tetrahymena thermophila (strain SB210) TaxID=312017 RepID=Q240Y3_TETTS|nr:hypothetical protein TTHERM_00623010 [Tetrahymena thermophila SB210]EAS02281.2 hypothetical protein TTHERM_00623010 [Tetrahymena thermophila SB210]|eukprot:XP_001022526.2 hypothetical protein TTHERM_00623010 [Tetrahymena thermophila SB210]